MDEPTPEHLTRRPQRCANCRYSAKAADKVMLVCRRYPKPEPKQDSDWCGEWTKA